MSLYAVNIKDMVAIYYCCILAGKLPLHLHEEKSFFFNIQIEYNHLFDALISQRDDLDPFTLHLAHSIYTSVVCHITL